MKKLLLLLAAGCIGVTAHAELSPKTYELVSFQKLSPDGRYLASEVFGMVQIFDLVENTTYDYVDDSGTMAYYLGSGNAINNTTLVGSAETDANAAYWQNGQWHSLPLGESESFSNLANGITPDGSRICGSVGVIEMTFDDATMLLPAVWQLKDDGTYDNFITLPHPTLDILGRAPQYITAISISDDGKTIAGTITDCVGRLIYPIVYHEQPDGDWTYTLPMEKFINTAHVELPEFPGEYPPFPQAADYMTPEQVAAYNEAYDAWAAGGYEGEMPEYTSYMSDEAKAQYDAAMEAHQAEAAVFEEKQDAYFAALEELYASSTSIIFNNIAISGDGKKIAVTAIKQEPDPTSWIPGGTKDVPNVWVIDLETEEIVKYETAEATLHSYCADGTVVAWGNIYDEVPQGYVLKDGQATSFYDYLTGISPEYKEWVDTNMKHAVESFDWDTEEVVIKEDIYSGLPLFSEDMKTIACWTPTPWDYDIMYQGYVFDLNENSAVKTVGAPADLDVYLNAAGELVVKGYAAKLAVYNLQGICLINAADVSGVVADKLSAGTYIAKAVAKDGSVKVVKVTK